MLVIFYTKSNSEIVGYFNDMSSPAKTEAEITANFYSDNSVSQNDIGHAVIAQRIFDEFDAGKYLFDSSTNAVTDNPNYVAPTPSPAEPTV